MPIGGLCVDWPLDLRWLVVILAGSAFSLLSSLMTLQRFSWPLRVALSVVAGAVGVTVIGWLCFPALDVSAPPDVAFVAAGCVVGLMVAMLHRPGHNHNRRQVCDVRSQLKAGVAAMVLGPVVGVILYLTINLGHRPLLFYVGAFSILGAIAGTVVAIPFVIQAVRVARDRKTRIRGKRL